MSKVSIMCILIISASLASCAPSMNPFYKPDVKVGHDMAYVNRVYLSELKPQTPDSSYVILPTCSGGVVAVRDVRRIGPERAGEICNEIAAKPPVDWRGIRVMTGVLTVGFLIYYFGFRGKTGVTLQGIPTTP